MSVPLTSSLDALLYLAFASLSPWVLCPDVVMQWALEIADVHPVGCDVHADLVCGDGQFNFAAVDAHFHAGGELSPPPPAAAVATAPPQQQQQQQHLQHPPLKKYLLEYPAKFCVQILRRR